VPAFSHPHVYRSPERAPGREGSNLVLDALNAGARRSLPHLLSTVPSPAAVALQNLTDAVEQLANPTPTGPVH
jgi:hypothetical protein